MEVSLAQVLDQLRIRISVVKKLLQQLEVRTWLLDNADLLKQFASCLALGAKIPSFEPERIGEAAEAAIALTRRSEASLSAPKAADQQRNFASNRCQTAPKAGCYSYKKRIRGLQGTFVYTSRHE